MSEAEQDLPQEFGSYTLHELIDRGGMAEIYRATMPGIGGFEKPVAIKKILPHLAEDEEFITMLIDEAQIIVNIEHANIAQVYDLGKLEGTYYIAMEFIHGVDLDAIIEKMEQQGRTVPLDHTAYITSCICAGLHVAHSKTDENGEPLNVVHRDLSPHNVLIGYGGDVKIIDFGVAKASVKKARTQAGVIKGKLLYMSPEQAKAKDLDGRADLFAVGICMYKMLTGNLPFRGENEFQTYNNILEKEIPPPMEVNPDVPREMNRIVMKLLERDRQKRYQDGYAVKEDLDKVLRKINPGYTENSLSRFVEKHFTDADPEELRQEPESRDFGADDASHKPGPEADEELDETFVTTIDEGEIEARETTEQKDGAPPGDDLDETIDIDSFDVSELDIGDEDSEPETEEINHSTSERRKPARQTERTSKRTGKQNRGDVAQRDNSLDDGLNEKSKAALSEADFSSKSSSSTTRSVDGDTSLDFDDIIRLIDEYVPDINFGSIPPVIYGVFAMIGIIFILALYLLFQ